jgi:3-oxoacyl-[acyl-carrier protein] reductase
LGKSITIEVIAAESHEMQAPPMNENRIISNESKSALHGKVCLVTGASRGIGRAIAERLARDGARVAINYAHAKTEAQELEANITARGGHAAVFQADLGHIPEIRQLFRACVKRFGRLDILVNNAASFLSKPLAETTEQEFDTIFAVNARGAFFAMQEAARYLPDEGRIINISSSATTVGFSNLAVYLGSKAALEQFTMVLANELGPRRITVNTVAAGPTETKMLANLLQTWPPEAKTMLVQRTPLGRIGEPADIADVVAFLAREESRWITGQFIRVDGGAR